MPLQDFFQQCFVEVGLLKHLFNAGMFPALARTHSDKRTRRAANRGTRKTQRVALDEQQIAGLQSQQMHNHLQSVGFRNQRTVMRF